MSRVLRLVSVLGLLSLPCLLCLLGTSPAARAAGSDLAAPAGLNWGASPQEVYNVLSKTAKYLDPPSPGDPDRFVEEQRYQGEFLGLKSDQIGALFFAGGLFGIAVSYTPDATHPAALLWEQAVGKLTALYGKVAKRSKPMMLVSLNAVLRLLPPDADKSKLMELYAAADKDPVLGRNMLLDLQVQTGSWVPDATWRFASGATIKAAMRAGAVNEMGLRSLKPTVLFTNLAGSLK